MKRCFVLIVISFFALTSISCAGPITYPDDYRNWTHAKSMVIKKGHPLTNPFEGIHHIYYNLLAQDGNKSGKYKNGSVIVFDLLEATIGDFDVTEGKRKFIGVMVRDENKFVKTGGWGYEVFSGDSKTERGVTDEGVSCFNCHESQKDNAFVFSKMR